MLRTGTKQVLALVLWVVSFAALTGCGIATAGSSTTGTGGDVAVPSLAMFGGNVHGGQQPIGGATVTLWAAGTTSTYGSGATQIASTVTDALGNFSLNPQSTIGITSYVIAGGAATFTTASNIQIPSVGQTVVLTGFTSTYGASTLNGQEIRVTAATATSITATVSFANQTAAEAGAATYQASASSLCSAGQYLYITGLGGNPGVAGSYGTVNNRNIGLMAAFPNPCVPTTVGSSYVTVNEVTTVAAVTALQQFMSINNADGNAWEIGTTPTNTAGMYNAFAQTQNLANLATGTSAAVAQTNKINGVTYTTTVTPDTAKINTLASILAYCVNQSSASGCSGFFAAVTPSGSGTATDTLQSMYYLATNPAGLNATSPGNLCVSYLSAVPPFQTTLACTSTYPYDWAIGVNWKTSNGSSTVGTSNVGSVAVDGNGNIWTAGYSGTSSNIVTEFNPVGQVLQTPISSVTVPNYMFSFYPGSVTPTIAAYTGTTESLGYGYLTTSIAIDTNNNAWFSSTGATSPGAVAGIPTTGVLAEVTQSGAVTGYLIGGTNRPLVIDGSNNIFVTDSTASSKYYISGLPAIPPVNAGAAIPYQSLYQGIGQASSAYSGLAMDSKGYVWALAPATGCGSTTSSTLARANIAGLQTNVTTANVSQPTCTGQGAGDANGNMWVVGSSILSYINLNCVSCSPTAPVTNSFTQGSGLTIGGMDKPESVTIDGLGHIWIPNGISATAGGVSEFSPTTASASPYATTITPLSPAGTSTAVYGFGSSYGWAKPGGTAIDSSGNVWVELLDASSNLDYLVGVAAPVTTPLASMYSKIAVRP